MSSICSTVSSLEDLPDEILLLICRYLSSIDVLFSFCGLNARLSKTISDYYRNVFLLQAAYARLTYICSFVLVDIGTNICSLVVSDQWNGILSKTFLRYFDRRMSLTFPRLERLTLISVMTSSLALFLNCLENLTKLCELNIQGFYEDINDPIGTQRLLFRIFSANNNRLTSISFDDDCLALSFEKKIDDRTYVNIKKLSIELNTLNDLHRILTVMPQLQSLHAIINEQSLKFENKTELVPARSLKDFNLHSFSHSWKLNELLSFIKRIPNVETLSINIRSIDDFRLVDGQQLFPQIPASSLKNFNYFLRFYSAVSSDHTTILSTWSQFNQTFSCVKSDDGEMLVLYTLPVVFSTLILQCSLSKSITFRGTDADRVRSLILFSVPTRVVEICPILSKCHRVKCLTLRIDENVVSSPFQHNSFGPLPSLTTLVALDTSLIEPESFAELLVLSPNLYHLQINFVPLRSLLDNESVCHLLRHRITHLYIDLHLPTKIELATSSIARLATVFLHLKHLYFNIDIKYRSAESLILAVFSNFSKWNFLMSFGVVNIKLTREILEKDLRQWVLANAPPLHDNNSFATDYTENTFRLWL